jgi:hypothetical protein
MGCNTIRPCTYGSVIEMNFLQTFLPCAITGGCIKQGMGSRVFVCNLWGSIIAIWWFSASVLLNMPSEHMNSYESSRVIFPIIIGYKGSKVAL